MFIFCPHGSIAVADQDLPLSRFHDHTVIHTTFGRTPLDEWSIHCRDFYLTTCNTQKR